MPRNNSSAFSCEIDATKDVIAIGVLDKLNKDIAASFWKHLLRDYSHQGVLWYNNEAGKMKT